MANATVLVHRTMPLDGFIAGADHEMDAGPIFVLAHHPPQEPEDPAFTHLSGDIRAAVATAAAAADGKRRPSP